MMPNPSPTTDDETNCSVSRVGQGHRYVSDIAWPADTAYPLLSQHRNSSHKSHTSAVIRRQKLRRQLSLPVFPWRETLQDERDSAGCVLISAFGSQCTGSPMSTVRERGQRTRCLALAICHFVCVRLQKPTSSSAIWPPRRAPAQMPFCFSP